MGETCTNIRAGRSERVQTTALSAVTSPACTPWVMEGLAVSTRADEEAAGTSTPEAVTPVIPRAPRSTPRREGRETGLGMAFRLLAAGDHHAIRK
ncbi:hypothetical protein JCM9957A_37100 [Kineosporia succinea]